MSEETQISIEKIGIDTEKIGHVAEKIPEIIPEQIRYRGQRGPDKARRRINPNSLKNLIQYQNISMEKSNVSDKWIWIAIGILVAILVGILIWRIYERWKEKQEEKGKTE